MGVAISWRSVVGWCPVLSLPHGVSEMFEMLLDTWQEIAPHAVIS